MKGASRIKDYFFPIFCGLILFSLCFAAYKFVKAAPLTGANADVGIYWHDLFGSTFTNDTANANDSDEAGDVMWPANTGTRKAYIGHLTTKFNKIYFDVSSAIIGSDTAMQLEYYNGSSWTDLTLDTGANPLYTAGVGSMSFTAPSDWATTSVNEISAYYIRTKANANGVSGASISQISLQTVTPPGVTVTESDGATSVIESGTTDTYTIVLNAAPSSNVTIAVSPDAYSTVSTSSIVFTTSNWNSAVTVTVSAVNNSIAEGTHTSQVTHTATSGDSGYNAITVSSVTASVTDNDTAGITVTQVGGTTAVTEGGVTDDITFVLTSAPTSTVTITLTPTSQITLSTSSIQFTSSNWDTAVTSTITAVNDETVEGTHTATMSYAVASSNWNYNNFTLTATSVSITDNDTEPVTNTSNNNSPSATPAPAPIISVVPEVTVDSAPATPAAPVEVNLQADQPIAISVSGESHTVSQVGIATVNQVTVVIQSDPITVTLLRDAPKEVDINKDGKPDMRLLYKGLQDGVPKMQITALTELGENDKAISINKGAKSTKVPEITLTLRAQNVSFVALSEDPHFTGASFIPYTSSASWILSPGAGEKTVYVRFRSPEGGTADSSDTIEYIPTNDKRTIKQDLVCLLSPGKAYQYANASGVYYILESSSKDTFAEQTTPCTKRPFNSAETFYTYFGSYQEIQPTTKEILDAIPDDGITFMPLGPLAKVKDKALVKQITSPKVYLLSENKLHWIQTEKVFIGMGFAWNAIEDISYTLFSKFIEGEPVANQ